MDPDAAEAPDIALIERDTIPLLADAGKILPLDDLIESSESLHKENLLDAALAYGTYNNGFYGLPERLDPYVLIYDTGTLSQVGISDIPRDWDSFIELSRFLSENALAQDQGKRWGISVNSMTALFHILCMQKGVDIFSIDNDGSASDSLTDILEFIRSLRRAHFLFPPKYKEWDPRHISLAKGMTFFEIGTAGTFPPLLWKRGFTYSIAMVPSDTSSPCTYLSNSSVFVISSSDANRDAVLRFLEFFYSTKCYSQFAKRRLFISPLKDVTSYYEEIASNSRQYSQLVSAAKNAYIYPLNSRTPVIKPQISRIVEQLDADLITPQTAASRIQETVRGKTEEVLTPAHTPVRVRWAESTRRLFADGTTPLRDPPIEILTGQNEHESFQLVFSSEEEFDSLRITGESFSSNNGRSFEPGMTMYVQADTEISKPMPGHLEGLYPNVLEPRASFEVVPGKRTRIWIEIFVASDVPAGEYSSRMNIERDGLRIARIPVKLRVLPLQIPEKPTSTAAVGLDYDRIAEHYQLEKESTEYKKIMDSFYWFLVDRRMSPYQPPVPIDSDELSEYLNNEKVTACRLSIYPLNPGFETAVEVAKSGGWLEKLFAYSIDEPTYHRYREIIEAGEYIHSMKAAPRFLVACFPDEPLIGAVDIWCIHLRFLPQGIPVGFLDIPKYVDAVDERLKAGDAVWWYTAGAVTPFPTLHIEDDPAAFRVIPWLQQLYRIDGFLHWETVNWMESPDAPFVRLFGNGEGVLIYPGELSPNPSIRLELLREGLEDMEYLVMLRRNIEDIQRKLEAEEFGDAASVRVGEICRRLIEDDALREHAMNNLFLLPHFVREPGSIERVREELACEVAMLDEKPYVLLLTEPEEKQYTDSSDVRIFGIVEPDCEVEVNGRKLTVSKSGRFSERFPLSSGNNVFSIEVKKGALKKLLHREILKF